MAKLNKINTKSEKEKRNYEKYCLNTEVYNKKTINCYFKAIYAYEEFTKYECLSRFNDDKAIESREHLVKKVNPQTGQKLALRTVYDYLRNKLHWQPLRNVKGTLH